VDLGIRATLPSSWIDFYGELGFAFALLSERHSIWRLRRPRQELNWVGGVSLGARLARQAGLTPFISLQAEFLPIHPGCSLCLKVWRADPYVWMAPAWRIVGNVMRTYVANTLLAVSCC